MIATVGTFDGVHRGHRYLIDRLVEEGAARGLEPVVVTFDRHPLELVRPGEAPAAIISAREQDEIFRSLGVRVIRLPFTPLLRAMTGSQFAAMLGRAHGVKALMLGYDNHMGADRTTEPVAPGIELVKCPPLPADSGGAVSSSAIRALIAAGEVDRAAAMLGRPYVLTGTVVGGRQLGRRLGFPTANLDVDGRMLLPAPGVYAGRAMGHTAVVNVGRRPTVDGADAPLSVEVHILDFSGDLYGCDLSVELTRRLREERKFASVEELGRAIALDIESARLADA
ncbi:MAG: riboflavin biosynthesis protein RibF [Muribaculaceae bacterium]|nr:riboflavin biosynthesis protein RibF [Muribaculaceae bacterium]